MSQISILNANWREEEELLKDLMSQPPIHNEGQENKSPTKDLSFARSQIKLREWGIKGLKKENFKLKQELLQITEEKNKISSEKKQLQKKVNELNEKLIGRTPLQGAKHLIWDTLAIEITKFKPYLNYVSDKNVIVDMAFQQCKVVNENLDKKPLDTSHNSINFLNTLIYEDMQKM